MTSFNQLLTTCPRKEWINPWEGKPKVISSNCGLTSIQQKLTGKASWSSRLRESLVEKCPRKWLPRWKWQTNKTKIASDRDHQIGCLYYYLAETDWKSKGRQLREFQKDSTPSFSIDGLLAFLFKLTFLHYRINGNHVWKESAF